MNNSDLRFYTCVTPFFKCQTAEKQQHIPSKSAKFGNLVCKILTLWSGVMCNISVISQGIV